MAILNHKLRLQVYNKGVATEGDTSEFGKYMLSYRHGDVYSPYTEVWEPLAKECSHFIECIRGNKKPLTDGNNGVEVVTCLMAALESMDSGEWVCL